MRFLLSLFLLLVASSAFARASDVLVLTPDNFDQHVGGDQPVFVEFFAPWCGHCKSLAPEYEIAATAFVRDPVKIASVDADAHRDLGSRFGVSGFPTLKYFPAGSQEGEAYTGGRTAADIIDFINRKVGTHAKIKKAPTSVTVLTPDNFNEIVLDTSKDVLVEFYAPWCGHCKRLEPEYEKVAKTFEGEQGVVIAKMDADAHRDTAAPYDVSGFPTIKFFPRSNKAGVSYEGGRDPQSFVDFINQEANTQRVLGGGFTTSAGRIDALDELARRFISDPSARSSILKETEALLADPSITSHANAEFAKFYPLSMKKILTDEAYAASESARLLRLIDGGNLKPANLAAFHKRKNILGAFAA